jgi:integrase
MDNLKLITYKVDFNRKNRLKQNGTAPITIRCYQNGIQKHIQTGISVEPVYWNEKRLEVKNSHSDAFILNKRIQEQIIKIKEYERQIINRHGSCRVGRITNYTDFRSNRTSFTDFYEQELNDSAYLSKNTIKTRRSSLKKLLSFNRNNKVYFDDLCYAFISRFDSFLYKEGLGTNTVKKHHKDVKTYINLAIKHDLFKIDKNPYKNFTPKSEEVEKISLSERELERIENLDFEFDTTMNLVRDAFLFSCYTGLRYSDYTRVSKSNLETTDKGLILRMKTQKPGKFMAVPLYTIFPEQGKRSKPEQVLLKYLNRAYYNDTRQFDELPFFKLSNQDANRKLKNIAELANVHKTLTTHVGRKTFATLAAVKVPLPMLQRLMQHSTPQETMRYVDDNPELLAKLLEDIDW